LHSFAPLNEHGAKPRVGIVEPMKQHIAGIAVALSGDAECIRFEGSASPLNKLIGRRKRIQNFYILDGLVRRVARDRISMTENKRLRGAHCFELGRMERTITPR